MSEEEIDALENLRIAKERAMAYGIKANTLEALDVQGIDRLIAKVSGRTHSSPPIKKITSFINHKLRDRNPVPEAEKVAHWMKGRRSI